MIVNRYQFPDTYDENPLEGTLTNAFLNALKFQNNGPLNLSLEVSHYLNKIQTTKIKINK